MPARKKTIRRPAAEKAAKKVGSFRVTRTGRTVTVGGVKRSFKTAAAAKGVYTKLRGKTAVAKFRAAKKGPKRTVKRPATKRRSSARAAARRTTRRNPSRAQIGKMTRRELKEFLESHGYVVYADEKIADLRATARHHAGQGLGPMASHPAWRPGGFPSRNPARRRNAPISRAQADALQAILRRHGHR